MVVIRSEVELVKGSTVDVDKHTLDQRGEPITITKQEIVGDEESKYYNPLTGDVKAWMYSIGVMPGRKYIEVYYCCDCGQRIGTPGLCQDCV